MRLIIFIFRYRKVALHLLLGTCSVNAFILFRSANPLINISLVDFRDITIKLLIPDRPVERAITSDRHFLRKIAAKTQGRLKRGRCVYCYKKNREMMSSALANRKTKKIPTYCAGCPGQPFMCIECFSSNH